MRHENRQGTLYVWLQGDIGSANASEIEEELQATVGDATDVVLDLTDVGDDTKVENGTWAETYDVLIAKIKSCTDTDKRYKMMHKAEDMLMATYAQRQT